MTPLTTFIGPVALAATFVVTGAVLSGITQAYADKEEKKFAGRTRGEVSASVYYKWPDGSIHDIPSYEAAAPVPISPPPSTYIPGPGDREPTFNQFNNFGSGYRGDPERFANLRSRGSTAPASTSTGLPSAPTGLRISGTPVVSSPAPSIFQGEETWLKQRKPQQKPQRKLW